MILSSCEKEEKLWELPKPGSEKIVSISMGETYENTSYFQLSTGNTTQRYLQIWDIAFSTDNNTNHLIINGGKEVQVHQTNYTNFNHQITTPTDNWQWDNPNGDIDSTAFGKWLNDDGSSKQLVYVVDIGKQNNPRYYKLQFLTVTDSCYTFKLSVLNDATGSITTIQKNNINNYIYFNLSTNETVDYEPPSSQWDLVFTRYRYIYYDMNPITPYQVNGTLINTKTTSVAEISNLTFDELDNTKAQQILLTKNADEIGFDWKYFDLNGSGKYTVNSKKLFLIKTLDGYYYKLKFIDFYDENGAKGTPKLAYQRL